MLVGIHCGLIIPVHTRCTKNIQITQTIVKVCSVGTLLQAKMATTEIGLAVSDVVLEDDSEENINNDFFISATGFNEDAARSFLKEHHWPPGLQDLFINNLKIVPIRYFVCDDSGSMSANDSKKIVVVKDNKFLIKCSRWSELIDTLKFHADMITVSQAPSEFRFINRATSVLIGTPKDLSERKFDDLQKLLKKSPENGTPLCRAINEIVAKIRSIEKTLRANDQKACVVIATDGEPTDGDLVEAMKPFNELPVIVVVKLCTDDVKVVDYWNSIDAQLEFDMDVIDDICNEAKQVHKLNPWLTYGEPIQRLREFGVTVKEMDFIDECDLSLEQLRTFAWHLYGGPIDSYPHPEVDWAGFVNKVRVFNTDLPQPWNAIEGDFRDWIQIKILHLTYQKQTACCSVS